MAKQHFNCPHCNQQIFISPAEIVPSHTPWQPVSSFHNTANSPFGTGSAPDLDGTWHKTTPIDRMQPHDVLTQLLDAGAAFLLVTAGSTTLCFFMDWPLLAGPLAGLAVATWRYFDGMATAKSLLQVVESWTGNRDASTGHTDPETKSHLVSLEVKEGKRWKFAYLGVDPKKLISFSEAVLAGKSFSEKEAAYHGITQQELGQLREEFLKQGWIEWNHPSRPQQGVTVRTSGKMVLRAITYTPLPATE